MQALMAQAAEIGEQLKAAKQTVAVAESSSGGLVSAALLSVLVVHALVTVVG